MPDSAPIYDVAVIGAGTAGCVLAEHLTRDGSRRVALIEAGGPPKNRFVAVPAGFARLLKSEVDWAFESEPQTALGGRRIFTPRGKMLGGSSNMNAQIHQWCHPADFAGWVAAGAAGWDWQDVAPIFRAQERWSGDDDPQRGHDGPMRIAVNRNARASTHAFVDAARRAGLGLQDRYNGGTYEGAWVTELAHHAGRRFSAYDAYLVPAMRRANLAVIGGAHVARIVFENGRARGVELRRENVTQRLLAHTVVLAAGAFGSPQILLLSGVGPADTLGRFGIPVQVDAPDVGECLQDHPVAPLVFRTHGTDTLKSAESVGSLLRYLLRRRGMLASNAVEGFAFTQVHRDTAAPPAPDLELMFLPLEYRREFLEPPREHAFSIAAAVVAPRSRGRLTLRSADPFAPPAIDFGLLTDPDGIDARVLCEGVRVARRIAATAPLAAHNAGELRPGPAAESDADILGYASREIQTVYHPTSTCRMGSDPHSVVDPTLRVRGVDGLWVADASVMPAVPRGHPNAAVAMIAERAATWIAEATRG